MKKDIYKSVCALTFLFLALFMVANLNNIKIIAKEEIRKNNDNNFINYHIESSINEEYNLPIVVIDTKGNSIKREEETLGEIQIYNNKDGLNKLTDIPQTTIKANFKIRGNSSSKYPKKQYSIDLLNGKGNSKEESILGMPKNSEWVLNAPFSDKSLLRNYLAFNTASNIMEYAPRVEFCEVFLLDDGSLEIKEENYQGVYIMVEKIERSADRVNITKTIENRDETSFIIAKDRKKENDIQLETYGKESYLYNNGFNIEYPKKNLTPQKYMYIEKYLSEFERILYSDNFKDPDTGYSKYIDVDSFVDFYLINEFFKNTDAGIYSTYFYKDYDEKMKAGPVWDFNKSLGNHLDSVGKPYEYEGFFMNQRVLFNRLIKDKVFADKVVKRYKELRKTYLSDEYLIGEIDKGVNILGEAVNRNIKKWPFELCNQAEVFEQNEDFTGSYSSNKTLYEDFLKENNHLLKSTDGKAKSYEEEIIFMKEFIINRGKWMDENIDSISKWAS